MGRKKPRCKKQRCDKMLFVLDLCKSHAMKEADQALGEMIKGSGVCRAAVPGFWIGPEFECKGSLSCCHLIPRNYRSLRWNLDNAVSMCEGHHLWFDQHLVHRELMLQRYLIETHGDKMYHQAITGAVRDFGNTALWEARLKDFVLYRHTKGGLATCPTTL